MSRQTRPSQSEQNEVVMISNTPVESIPEVGMTAAAAASAPKVPEIVGEAAALSQEPPEDAPVVKWYRILADRKFTSVTGFRAKLYAGKEFSSTMYNVDDLRRQGVKFEEIEAPY